MATQATALKGQHKELSNVISNLSPYDTPFQSMIGSGKVSNYLFNWAEEKLADAGENAFAEGAAAGEGTDNILIERDNYTQIFRKTVALTGTAQATALAGGVQKMAHQVELRSREMKRDIEKAYLSGQAKATASGIRKTAGYKAQCDASVVVDMTGKTFDEAALNALLAKLYENGATPNVIMTSPKGRLVLSAALEKTRVRDIADTHKAAYGISTYASDFGTLEIHTNRFCADGDILVMDTSLWSEEILRPYKLETIAKQGDADVRMLVVEKGLKNKNQLGSGMFIKVAM